MTEDIAFVRRMGPELLQRSKIMTVSRVFVVSCHQTMISPAEDVSTINT